MTQPPEAAPHLRAIAAAERGLFGKGEVLYRRCFNADETSFIDVMECQNSPLDGVTSWATIGMSDLDIHLDLDGRPLGVELLAAFYDEDDVSANILGSCFFDASDGRPVRPNAVFPNVIRQYVPDSTVEHFLLVNSSPWRNIDDLLVDSPKPVGWLFLFPITEAELEYGQQHGGVALEKELNVHHVNAYDLRRESCV